jgi:pSer/pThr/pTyr-binding forkhead associated (FHA) protein
VEPLIGPEGTRFADFVTLASVLTVEDLVEACPGPFVLQIPLELLEEDQPEEAEEEESTSVFDNPASRTTQRMPPAPTTKIWDGEALVSLGRSKEVDRALVHYLGGARTLIGRMSECDATLRDYALSRKHAEVIRSGARWEIVDLQSKNQTFLDEQALQPGLRYELVDGQRIRLGAYRGLVLFAKSLFGLARKLGRGKA